MDTLKDELKIGITPLDAIEEAVKESIWLQTQDEIAIKLKHATDPASLGLKDVVKSGTRGMCFYGSFDVVRILATKNRDLFQNILLISTEKFNEDSPLIKERYQYLHTYFIGQDNEGIWNAISPANHESFGDKDYAITLIRDKDLGALIGKMEKRDSAEYPHPEDITNSLEDTSPKSITANFSVLELRSNYESVVPISKRYPLDTAPPWRRLTASEN